MSRRQAREFALQFIFSRGFNPEDDVKELLENFIEAETAVVERLDFTKKDMEFADCLIEGAIKNMEALDELISKSAIGWTFDRISKVDLAILRLAIFEICFLEEVPEGVSANEAVELAKKYSADDAGGFVNGVIGKVIRERNIHSV